MGDIATEVYAPRAQSQYICAESTHPAAQQPFGRHRGGAQWILAARTMELSHIQLSFLSTVERDLAVCRVLEPIARMCAESFGFSPSPTASSRVCSIQYGQSDRSPCRTPGSTARSAT